MKSQGQVCLPATMLTGSEADCLDVLCRPEGLRKQEKVVHREQEADLEAGNGADGSRIDDN